MKVVETFESGMMPGGKYFETIDHRVYYRDNSTKPNYYSYEDINSHLSSYFPGNVARTLKECFIKILKGENTTLQDASQRKFIILYFTICLQLKELEIRPLILQFLWQLSI